MSNNNGTNFSEVSLSSNSGVILTSYDGTNTSTQTISPTDITSITTDGNITDTISLDPQGLVNGTQIKSDNVTTNEASTIGISYNGVGISSTDATTGIYSQTTYTPTSIDILATDGTDTSTQTIEPNQILLNSNNVKVQGLTQSGYFVAIGASGELVSTPNPAAPGATAGSFGITIDGGGSAITTGVKGYVEIPYDGVITGWTILADQSGSIVIDIWKDTFANFPPIVADTIAGSEKPTLSSVIKNQDLTLSTWTTSVTAGDIIAFNVDSASTVTRVNLAINITKL
jgi:hypothetical protein